MPGDVYSADQILNKTLYAKKAIPIYNGVPSKTNTPVKIGTIPVGSPVGMVYSYIDADAANNRANLWWVFFPSTTTGAYYYAEHHVGDYDTDSLSQQGALTTEEQKAAEEEANKTWYEKIADKIIPVVLIVGIGGAVVKGVLSRKSS